jgi:uncharacterized protein YacL
VLFILIEFVFTKRYIGTISVVMFGLIFGFIISSLFLRALFYIPAMGRLVETAKDLKEWLEFSVTFLFSFIAIIAILRTKDDFKFVIPFIELSREAKGVKPIIVDTSVIIDGRLASLTDINIFNAPLIVPRFVLQELQGLADSSDRQKRIRGRHGLDILNRIQKATTMDVQIQEVELPHIQGADNKLVELAKHLNGRIMTNDFNLNKVAQLQGIDVININDLANALKQVFLPGEEVEIRIIRPGEEPYQGVGYLNDGTMVVVENASNRIGQKVMVTVTSVLQTSAGKMVFASLGSAGPSRSGMEKERDPAGRDSPRR